MSLSRPYKPVVKKGSAAGSKKQQLISDFFRTNKPNSDQPSQIDREPSTPKKEVKLNRTESLISRSTRNGSSFEENGTSDTSMSSPEMHNFKNPALAYSYKSAKPQKANSWSESSKQNEQDVEIEYELYRGNGEDKELRQSNRFEEERLLKREGNDILEELDNFNRRPKKLLRTFKSNQERKTSVEVSSQVMLSSEQNEVVKYVVEDELSVFYTGSAGTGKSVVLREIIRLLYAKYGYSRVGLTASTGLAACNIGGQTLHRYLAIGIGAGSPLELAQRIKKNSLNYKRWKNLKVLIIDEVSMIDGKLFTKLDEVAQILRGNHLPFGGIQVVCTGDFFQLPPVNRDSSTQFCFQSPSWKQVINKTILLSNVYRQKGDLEFIDMLNALRYGEMDDVIISKFASLSREVKYDDGLEPTELFPTREEVKRANQTRLNQLPTKSIKYSADDNVRDPLLVRLLDNLMCEKELELKERAQVMYLKNFDDQLFNGSIGTIQYFMTARLWDKVNDVYQGLIYDDDDQIMLELKFLSSRVGINDTLSNEEHALINRVPHGRKSQFMKLVYLASNELTTDLCPVVDFKTPTGNRITRIGKEEFNIDAGKVKNFAAADDEKLTRRQLPLLLSWAISIHKAQGQSIDRLRIDLRKIFEKGQVYVALSRATNKNHLQILNFDARRITTSAEVKGFYKSLEKEKTLTSSV